MFRRSTLAAVVAFQLGAGFAWAVCGNGIVEPGETCDGAADSACPGTCDAHCACPPAITVEIRSAAQPRNTPGSPGVAVTNPKLLTQLGPHANLNRARYTRYQLDASGARPDAILILIPGFEGGAADFRILAQNLLVRAQADHGLRLEVWGFDRRTNQLEDKLGLDLAEQLQDPPLGENWLFGGELGRPLDPRLTRRAVFYDAQGDVPFIANWTNLVFSQDVDAVVRAARRTARRRNVFLGGHSAGTGFTARYAATNFNIRPNCAGTPEPGYAKLRGLVLLEGGGGSTAGVNDLAGDTLDRIVAKFDGGLFGAVRDDAPRCVDGTTPCTIATEAAACAGQTPPKCTPPTTAYALVPGILNPRILASSEALAVQSISDLNTGPAMGREAIMKVPDLASLAAVPPATVEGSFGFFLDKRNFVAQLAPFVAMSVGRPGPVVDGILTWQDILHGGAVPRPDLGPPPTSLPAGRWGADLDVTRLDRVLWAFFAGRTGFSDWYYPSSGQSVTSAPGLCAAGTCAAGRIGAACASDAQCAQAINLDSTPLSAPVPVGRGRCDIENLTQAAHIDIPVIAFGGSAGLATVPGDYTAFAQSIGRCTAPSCDGTTPRVMSATTPNPAFPTFGDVAGGFQVFISQGYAHLDIVTAEDDANNHVIGPLSDFIARNLR